MKATEVVIELAKQKNPQFKVGELVLSHGEEGAYDFEWFVNGELMDSGWIDDEGEVVMFALTLDDLFNLEEEW